MVTRWRCPNCSFYNDYTAERCISCNQPRPSDAETPETVSLDSKPPTRRASAPRPDPVVATPPRPRTAPQPVPPTPKKSRIGRSPTRVALLGVMVVVGVIAAVGALAGRDAGPDTDDNQYLDAFWTVNDERNDVIDLSNERYDAWMESPAALPGPEFLVHAELSDLQRSAELMAWPESDTLRNLHEGWLATLRSLAAAEQLLAQEPSETNLDADFYAWGEEDAAYTDLYDYCKGP